MARKSETDLSRYDWSKAERGKYAEKARRSFETVLLDKKVVTALGGPHAIQAILAALADAMGDKKRAARKSRRAA